jgi:hypothetical protein
MMRLSPDATCDWCGGLLVPREMSSLVPVAADNDYVCMTCGRPYFWAGHPPRLVSVRFRGSPAQHSVNHEE